MPAHCGEVARRETVADCPPAAAIDLRLIAIGLDPQIICYREDPRDAVRANEDQVLVTLVVDDAFERHMPALDDDVNRWHGSKGIPVQCPL